MRTLRVAMIGAGGHACHAHYPSLHELEDVELVAVAELDTARAQAVQERYGIAAHYRDYREMIEQTRPDAVYLIMPPQIIYQHALWCLRQGVNLFIEKPPGLTSEQTRHLARAAAEHDVITMVGFQRRYAPLVQTAVEEARARGGIDLAVSCFYKHNFDGSAYFDGEVDILTCDGIHAVDLLRSLCGEVVSVASDLRGRHLPYENFFTALLTFDSGATGVLLSNFTSGGRTFKCEVHAKGYGAWIDIENDGKFFKDGAPEGPQVISSAQAAGGDAIWRRGGFLAQNRMFMDCVREKRQPPNNLDDAVNTMTLLDRLRASTLPTA